MPRRAPLPRPGRCRRRSRPEGRATRCVACSRMPTRFRRCAEKVDRLIAIDCSSPMSTRISSKTGSAASSAGGRRPHWYSAAARPSVFSATVLPPVFGPLITSARRLPSSRSIGTAVARSSSGCRAPRRTTSRLGVTSAPRQPRESVPRAITRSSSADASHERDQRLRLACDERGEVAEDPRHLVALGDLGFAQPVRVLDRRERLDEQRLPRARRVVHDPRHAAAGRCLEREHGPARRAR